MRVGFRAYRLTHISMELFLTHTHISMELFLSTNQLCPTKAKKEILAEKRHFLVGLVALARMGGPFRI